MKKLSATVIGLITGIIMIGISLAIYNFRNSFENNLQYVTYAVYVAGIIYALVVYRNATIENKTFKSYFSQGFKCFIVITLLMVVFTWVFIKMHPELQDQMAVIVREELIKKGDDTPAQIDEKVANAKKYFSTMLTGTAIFGYLFIGALVTVIGAAFLNKMDKDKEASHIHPA